MRHAEKALELGPKNKENASSPRLITLRRLNVKWRTAVENPASHKLPGFFGGSA